MNVFVITYQDPYLYGSDNPQAVRSTRALAEQWIAENPDSGGYKIHEFVIDGDEVLPEPVKPWLLVTRNVRVVRKVAQPPVLDPS